MNAACRSMPVSMFYPPLGLRGYSLRNLERQAKLVCDRCPVVTRCLQHALDTDERHGVWGGSTAHERSAMARVNPDEQRSPGHLRPGSESAPPAGGADSDKGCGSRRVSPDERRSRR
ncbi:Redox-responsive transcriptional regulator WhiB3 [Rhodococcoides fascians]|nr:Redox-responsive transcriptional regulator WhiB3 [Rhodococcus fascians]